MIPRLNWGFVAVLIFVGAIWVLMSMAASALPAHPFVVLAQVCVVEKTGDEPVCQIFRSNDQFDTEEQCNAEAPGLAQRLADRLHAERPTWNTEVRYLCRPNLNELNT